MNGEKVVKKIISSLGYAKAVLKDSFLKALLTNQAEQKAYGVQRPAHKVTSSFPDI